MNITKLPLDQEVFPKRQLEIRNQRGGMVWQVYHVETVEEIAILSINAHCNQFEDVCIQDDCDMIETAPADWRESDGWKTDVAKYRNGELK